MFFKNIVELIVTLEWSYRCLEWCVLQSLGVIVVSVGITWSKCDEVRREKTLDPVNPFENRDPDVMKFDLLIMKPP